jgi:hypothetical protein
MMMHGVRLTPARDKQQPPQQQQLQQQHQQPQRKPPRQQQQQQRQQQEELQQGQDPAMPADDSQPMDTSGDGQTALTRKQEKKKERDAKRHAELRHRQRREPWARLASPLYKRDRWAAVQVEWTAWMRHRQSVRLRLKGLLWRAWTLPQKDLLLDGPSALLGDFSLRDRYIYERTTSFLDSLPELRDEDGYTTTPLIDLGPCGQDERRNRAAWQRGDPGAYPPSEIVAMAMASLSKEERAEVRAQLRAESPSPPPAP